MTAPGTPVVEGWFQADPEPRLLGSRCAACGAWCFPPVAVHCPNPACQGGDLEVRPLSRRGRVWSFTDARYQPPPPFVPRHDPYRPFALAAVELAEGLVVLGQVADGYGLADLAVGAEVEVVVEPLDDRGPGHTVWRWRPVAAPGDAS